MAYNQKITLIISIFNQFCVTTRNTCGNNHGLAAKLIHRFGWKLSKQMQKEYHVSANRIYDILMN